MINKEEIIRRVAFTTGVNPKVVKVINQSIFEHITDLLVEDETVRISSFGAFFTRIRKKRWGVDPRTSEKIFINDVRVVKFIAGSGLKRAVKK